jgi:pyrroline-5-carboxylate reductase
MNVAIVGGGVMGEAILGAALERGVFSPDSIIVAEIVEARRNELHARYGVRTTGAASDAMGAADLVVLSVKPQDMRSVGASLPPSSLLISVMAGVTIATLRETYAHERIVRVMPNTPVAVRAGMSVWTATADVSHQQKELARGLLAALGHELFVADERKLDMATAVSGSGPAYVFLFIEALIEGGVAVGLSRKEAEEMVVQTVYGSALYARQSRASVADLRAQVTSPAGTTAAGLLQLERAALRAALIDGVRAAFARSVELGQQP